MVRSTDPLNRMQKEDQIEVSKLLNSLNADFLCLEARSDLGGLLVPLKKAHLEAEVVAACSRIPGVEKAEYYTKKP